MIRGVYLVADPDHTAGRSVVEIVDAALRGGSSVVQWRQKSGSIAAQWEELLAVRDLCRAAGVPLVINDRIDVALAIGANGVHVGQQDLPAGEVRRIFPEGELGISVSSPAEVVQALQMSPTYLGVGPVFPTISKNDTGPIGGIEFIRTCRTMTDLPLIAIGGITVETAQSVMSAGADGIAVISAICSAPDPEAAARRLVESLEGAQ
ncbi:MAG: thiamine phosphate synthase [Chloroflexota bacterium]